MDNTRSSKTLLRTAPLPAPQTVVSRVGSSKPRDTSKEPEKCDKKLSTMDNLSIPQRNSSLQTENKIKSLTKNGKTQIKDCKLALEEKATKRVNFPYDKPIYKNLIPLVDCPEKPVVRSNRIPLLPKDEEPNLQDFLQKRESKDFNYHPTIHSETKLQPIITTNSFRLFKTLKNLSNPP